MIHFEGVEEGPTCAVADPSFNVTEFKNGKIRGGKGWFCLDPFSTNTVPKSSPKPPNKDNSILIAQFVVKEGYSVDGSVVVIVQKKLENESINRKQMFSCFCENGEFTKMTE